MKHLNLAIAILLVAIVGFSLPQDNFDERRPYKIEVGSVAVEPQAHDFNAAVTPGHRFIVQFESAPSVEDVRAYRLKGIEIGEYVDGNAFYARINDDNARLYLAELNTVRATLPIQRDMKIDADFRRFANLQERVRENTKCKYLLKFHRDISSEDLHSILSGIDHQVVRDLSGLGNIVEINTRWSEIESILDNDAIAMVEPGKSRLKQHDKTAQYRTNVKNVLRRNIFRKASGKGVKVGIWESANVAEHTDFEDRLKYGEKTDGVSQHATNVAGVLGGEGKKSGKTEGQAPDALMYSYDWDDSFNEVEQAFKGKGIVISNHSYGYVAGWNPDEDDSGNTVWTWNFDWLFQDYDSEAEAIDDMIRDNDVLIVTSAGNDRNEGFIGRWKKDIDDSSYRNTLKPNDPIYGSLVSWANCKNVLSVGSVSRDNQMTDYSAWGPTGDGRVKPDVVASGEELRVPTLGNTYDDFSGTSAAAPVASGSAALLSHYYKERHGSLPGGMLLKNLLIHSGYDLGRPGPDYEYGFGLVDNEYAARVIKKAVFKAADWPEANNLAVVDRDASMNSMIIEDSISNGGKKLYKINLDKNYKNLRATLVWNDAGKKRLVNNLNLDINYSRGGIFFPWVLNPKKPANNATKGSNSRDNVERIDIENPGTGEYTVRIWGVRIPEGPQEFTLIISASSGHNQIELKYDEGEIGGVRTFVSSESDYQTASGKRTFNTGDDLYLFAYVQIKENAYYDFNDSWGVVTGHWEVFEKSSGDNIYETYSTIELPENDPGSSWILRIGEFDIPDAMDNTSYALRVTWTMPNGSSKSDLYNFRVR